MLIAYYTPRAVTIFFFRFSLHNATKLPIFSSPRFLRSFTSNPLSSLLLRTIHPYPTEKEKPQTREPERKRARARSIVGNFLHTTYWLRGLGRSVGRVGQALCVGGGEGGFTLTYCSPFGFGCSPLPLSLGGWMVKGREGALGCGREWREVGAMAETGLKLRRLMWLRGGGCCGGR